MSEIKVYVIAPPPDRRSFMLRYTDPATGRKVSRSAGTTKRKEAVKAAGAWEAELRAGRYAGPNKLLWETFRERYESEVLPSMAERTAEPVAAVFNHVEAILAPRRLSDLTTNALSRFQSKLREKGLKETTIAGHLAHLRSALAWAKSVGMLTTLPEVRMPNLAKGRSLMRGRPITAKEFDRMIAAVPEVRPNDPDTWTRFLTGLWLSGLRLGEAVILSWDPDAEISVDLTGKHPRLRIWAEAEKGGKNRVLPLTPDFATWLLKTPARQRSGNVFKLPTLTNGRQMSIKRISRTISAIGKAAGVVVNKADGKYASCHDLRRAFATRWAPRLRPATLKLLMRHESIETTMSYYVDQNSDDVADDLWANYAPGRGKVLVSGQTV